MRSYVKMTCLAAMILFPCALLSVPSPASAATPKAKITAFGVPPATLAYFGGPVTLTGSVANATSCTISVTPPVSGSGLPLTTPCGTGPISDVTVTLPENLTTKEIHYVFTLAATGVSNTVSKHGTVTVDPPGKPTALYHISPTLSFGDFGIADTISMSVQFGATCQFSTTSSVLVLGTTTPIDCSSGYASSAAVTTTASVPPTTDPKPQNFVVTATITGLTGQVKTYKIVFAQSEGSAACLAYDGFGCNDSWASLANLDLTSADFSGTFLADADLSGSNLTGVSFDTGDLEQANLTDANLTDANLAGAIMTGAIMTGVIYSDTECPNETNSDNDGGTCAGQGGGL